MIVLFIVSVFDGRLSQSYSQMAWLRISNSISTWKFPNIFSLSLKDQDCCYFILWCHLCSWKRLLLEFNKCWFFIIKFLLPLFKNNAVAEQQEGSILLIDESKTIRSDSNHFIVEWSLKLMFNYVLLHEMMQ